MSDSETQEPKKTEESPEPDTRTLRTDRQPTKKGLENEATSLCSRINKVFRHIKKYWVAIEDFHVEGDSASLVDKQQELRALDTEFKECIIKFKLLKQKDVWDVFSDMKYCEILVKEPYVIHDTEKALILRVNNGTESPHNELPNQLSGINLLCLATAHDGLSPDRGELRVTARDDMVGHSHHGALVPQSAPLPPGVGREGGAAGFGCNSLPSTEVAMQNSFLKEIFLKQHLPKVLPDVFSGEPTQFHAWKSSFDAMIAGTNISATQVMVYLLQFTSKGPRQLVEAFRSRRLNPEECLTRLWVELKRRYGSSGVVANSYIARLAKAACYKKEDRQALKSFVDLCEDIVVQMDVLPTLACLNFPTSAGVIYGKLHEDLKKKWNGKLLSYADENDLFPPFQYFVKFISKRARIENN